MSGKTYIDKDGNCDRRSGNERRIQMHHCHDWDGLLIDNMDSEFEDCLCYEEPYDNNLRSGEEQRRD